jgi:hypothetical protein
VRLRARAERGSRAISRRLSYRTCQNNVIARLLLDFGSANTTRRGSFYAVTYATP